MWSGKNGSDGVFTTFVVIGNGFSFVSERDLRTIESSVQFVKSPSDSTIEIRYRKKILRLLLLLI